MGKNNSFSSKRLRSFTSRPPVLVRAQKPSMRPSDPMNDSAGSQLNRKIAG